MLVSFLGAMSAHKRSRLYHDNIKVKQCPYRHGHFSNAIDHDDQQPKEGETCNLLAVIGADMMHVGAQEQGRRADPQHKDLEGLGLVQDHGALDERELPRHQGFPALKACVQRDDRRHILSHICGEARFA